MSLAPKVRERPMRGDASKDSQGKLVKWREWKGVEGRRCSDLARLGESAWIEWSSSIERVGEVATFRRGVGNTG